MNPPKSHYSNYLISVRFDRLDNADSLSEQIQRCEDFLNEIGKLARKSAIRLHATYSIVSGNNAIHAHFACNWIPTIKTTVKRYKGHFNPIKRWKVVDILRNNGFYVDNEKEAVKRITARKEHVTDYVVYQPKDGQTTVHTSFFIYDILEANHSERLSRPYSSGLVSLLSERVKKVSRNQKELFLIMISITLLILIKLIMVLIS